MSIKRQCERCPAESLDTECVVVAIGNTNPFKPKLEELCWGCRHHVSEKWRKLHEPEEVSCGGQ